MKEDLDKLEAELRERVAYLQRELDKCSEWPDDARLVVQSTRFIEELEAAEKKLDAVRRQIGPPRFFKDPYDPWALEEEE